MASTRNKNTPGNYAMEQWSLHKQYNERTYIHSTQGKPIQTNFAGDGLLTGKIAGRDLAKNDCDIESFLFGIGSTNLVQPLPKVVPQIESISSLNMIHKIPMVNPNPIMIDGNQRWMYLN
jgi:hypothetical protein